jgi:methionyl aminopeptidase
MITTKSPQEIDLMRESCRIVSDVHRLLAPHLRAGMRLADLDTMAEDFIRSCGGRPAFKGYASGLRSVPPFPATLCISINHEVVHGIPDGRTLEEGQLVSIDVGVEKDGFYGDGAMTVTVGPVSAEAERLLAVTKESFFRGIDKAYPGNRLHDISAAVQEYVEANGFSVVRDLVGHGIGRRLHEDPAVPNFGTRGTGPELQAGMTLAVEPMVNSGDHRVRVAKNGWTVLTRDEHLSAHFEHTVLISADGPVLLTDHFLRDHGEARAHHS